MKNLKYKEKVQDNQVAKEEKKRLDREYLRIKRIPYYDEERKQNERKKFKETIKQKRNKYDEGIWNKSKYLEWLESDKKKKIE